MTIERQTGQMPTDLTELRRASWCRKTDPMHMAVDVEVVVLHPDGMIEVQEAVGRFLPERRHRPEPRRQLVTEMVVAVTAGNRRGVQFQHRNHLQRLRCGL